LILSQQPTPDSEAAPPAMGDAFCQWLEIFGKVIKFRQFNGQKDFFDYFKNNIIPILVG
jgi:hypothetical protein